MKSTIKYFILTTIAFVASLIILTNISNIVEYISKNFNTKEIKFTTKEILPINIDDNIYIGKVKCGHISSVNSANTTLKGIIKIKNNCNINRKSIFIVKNDNALISSNYIEIKNQTDEIETIDSVILQNDTNSVNSNPVKELFNLPFKIDSLKKEMEVLRNKCQSLATGR